MFDATSLTCYSNTWIREDQINNMTYREHWLRFFDLLHDPKELFKEYPPPIQHGSFDYEAFTIQMGHLQTFNLDPPSKPIREFYQAKQELRDEYQCDAPRPPTPEFP